MALNGGTGGSSAAIRAGGAYVELFTKDIGVKSGLKAFEKAFASTAAMASRAGLGAIAAGSAILAPIGAIFQDVIERGDQFQKAADRLGSTSEILSGLGYAAQQSGASFEDLEAASKFLHLSIANANPALREMGLNAQELQQLPLDERFIKLADVFSKVGDETQRTAYATAVLGKNGRQMLPFLLSGAEGIRDLLQEGLEAGAVVSSSDAQNAVKIGDAIDRSWTSAKNAVRAVGAALLPAADQIEEVSRIVMYAAKGAREFINQNRQMVLAAVAVGAGLVAAGGVLVGFAGVMAAASFVAGGLVTALTAAGAVLGFVATPIGALTILAAGAAIGLGYLFATSKEGKSIMADAAAYFSGTADTFRTTWGGIADAMKSGDLELAGQIALAGLDVEWKRGLAALQKEWNDFKAFFVDGWKDALFLAEMAINDWSAAIAKKFVQLAVSIGQSLNSILPKELSQRLGLDVFAVRGFGKAAQGFADRDRQAEENRLVKAREAEQEAANAARQAAQDAANLDVAAAQAELEVLRIIAETYAAVVGAKGPGTPGGLMGDLANSGSRGTFTAAVAGQVLGGNNGIPAKQLKAQEEGNKLLKDGFKGMIDAMNNNGAVFE
jgi:hypothetical protein